MTTAGRSEDYGAWTDDTSEDTDQCGTRSRDARDRPRPGRQMLSETENSPKVFISNYGSIDNGDILVYLGELPFKLMDQIR